MVRMVSMHNKVCKYSNAIFTDPTIHTYHPNHTGGRGGLMVSAFDSGASSPCSKITRISSGLVGHNWPICRLNLYLPKSVNMRDTKNSHQNKYGSF